MSFARLDTHIKTSPTCSVVPQDALDGSLAPIAPSVPASSWLNLPLPFSAISLKSLQVKWGMGRSWSTVPCCGFISSTGYHSRGKNTYLCKGIHDVLANHFGTGPTPWHQQYRVKKHDTTLYKVTQLKNRQVLPVRKVKSQSESVAIILGGQHPLSSSYL